MEVLVPFGTCLFDPIEDRPHRIDERQQGAGDIVVEFDLSVAQLPEEVLTAVSNGAELRKAEEAAGTLDRVDGAEDARKELRITGILFQRHQVTIELIEILRRLDEKFTHEFFVVVHGTAAGSSPPVHHHPWPI